MTNVSKADIQGIQIFFNWAKLGDWGTEVLQ